MEKNEIFRYVDHTLLKTTASTAQLKELCDDAIAYGTASVCIPPDRVRQVRQYVGSRMRICTVIGFPNGYNTTSVKAQETSECISAGADEIDMVINRGMVKDGLYNMVKSEIMTIKDICDDKILKVIVETCDLTQEEKIRMCEIVTESGADYIKTSTGFGSAGATFEDVALFRRYVGPHVKIKAAGGLSSFEDARKFIELGASRLGTSRLVNLAKAGKL